MRLGQLFRLTRFISVDEDLSAHALDIGADDYIEWRKRRVLAKLIGLMESMSLPFFLAFELVVGMFPERLTYWTWGAAYLPIGVLLWGAAMRLKSSSARLDHSAWKSARWVYRVALLLQSVYMVVAVLSLATDLPVNQMTLLQFGLLLMVVWNVVFLSLDPLGSLAHPLIISPAIALSLAMDGRVEESEAAAIALGALMVAMVTGVSLLMRRILQTTYTLEYESLQQVAELKARSESMRLQARQYSVLVAEVGHDLRQPVQAISLAVRSLTESQDTVSPSVRTIEACATSLEFALNSMLDYSRLNFGLAEPAHQPIELDPLLKRLEIEFASAAQAKGVTLRVQSNDAVVLADPHALYRILGNLIQNALKFTHEGEVAVLAVAAGGEWQLMVTDTGPGIPPERQAQIFEQFVSGDELGAPASRGLGLGLAIAQRFAETMGTRLECVSQPEVGTQFLLRLPTARRERRRTKRTVDVQALAGRKVLLIDDDRFILDALAGFLRRHGLVVHPYTHTNMPSFADEAPDLIVSDHFLDGQPLGLEGILHIRERQGRPDLPAILLTGDLGVHISRLTEEMGVMLIHKPASPESLLVAISRLLSLNPSSDTAL